MSLFPLCMHSEAEAGRQREEHGTLGSCLPGPPRYRPVVGAKAGSCEWPAPLQQQIKPEAHSLLPISEMRTLASPPKRSQYLILKSIFFALAICTSVKLQIQTAEKV